MRGDLPVLFLHPVGLDSRAIGWLDVPGLRAATLPGHGSRRRQRAGLTLDDMADEVLGWTDGPLHVIGCSMGGMVAMRLALRCPEKVASLVLGYTTASVPYDAMMERAAETERRGAVDMTDDTLARWFTAEALAGPLAEPVEYARTCLREADTGALADTWRAVAGHDVLAELPRLSIPTTCIAGRRDASTPLPAMEAIASAIPGAELVVTDDPHMGFLENPRNFSALVRVHLDRTAA